MDIEKTFASRRNRTVFALVASFVVLGAICGASPLAQDANYEAGIVGMIVGALVGVVVAVALIPVIANQSATLQTDSAGDLDTSEEALIGLWPLLVIVGVMMGIIGLAL